MSRIRHWTPGSAGNLVRKRLHYTENPKHTISQGDSRNVNRCVNLSGGIVILKVRLECQKK